LGFPTGSYLHAIKHFFWRHCRGERRFLQGESLTSNLLLCYCFALFYFFCLHRFIKNTKKISSFIVVTFTCLLLVLLEWVLLRTPSCVILLALKTMILSALLLRHLLLRQIFMKIKPALLNLVMKEKFSGASSDDAAAHLNNFVELYEMQKYKDVDGAIIKLKLFPFSLRG
jgi:hypothetical protein